MGGELFSNAEFGYYKVIQFDTNVTNPCVFGRMSWNSNDNLPEMGLSDDVCGQFFVENYLPPPVKNVTGIPIVNGTPVYISDATGTVIEVSEADASIPDLNRKTIAVATEDVPNNQMGFFTTFGRVHDFDTSAFSEGDELYVAVGGGLTNVKPALPNGVVRIGICTRSHAVVGEIYVNIENKSIKEVLTDSGDLTIRSQAQKTVVLEQPVWDDIIIPITRTRIPVANFPAWTTFIAPTSMYIFIVNDYVEFSFEMPHDYKEGTNFDVHLHGATNGLDGTDRFIKFQVDYTVQNNAYNITTGIGNAYSSNITGSFEFKIPANTTDKSGFYFDITEVIGTNIKIGSQINMKLTRITSVGTAPTNSPFISTVGVHYQIDTIGSRQETVK